MFASKKELNKKFNELYEKFIELERKVDSPARDNVVEALITKIQKTEDDLKEQILIQKKMRNTLEGHHAELKIDFLNKLQLELKKIRNA